MCSKFAFWSNFGLIYPLKESEIEQGKRLSRKNLSTGLSKYSKIEALSRLNFELEIQLLFALFGVF